MTPPCWELNRVSDHGPFGRTPHAAGTLTEVAVAALRLLSAAERRAVVEALKTEPPSEEKTK